MEDLKYYEIIFGNRTTDEEMLANGLDVSLAENRPDSICILAIGKPTIKQAERFCAADMKLNGWDYVFSVTEISAQEAHDCFDMGNVRINALYSENRENRRLL